jgi:hypothetical protein
VRLALPNIIRRSTHNEKTPYLPQKSARGSDAGIAKLVFVKEPRHGQTRPNIKGNRSHSARRFQVGSWASPNVGHATSLPLQSPGLRCDPLRTLRHGDLPEFDSQKVDCLLAW